MPCTIFQAFFALFIDGKSQRQHLQRHAAFFSNTGSEIARKMNIKEIPDGAANLREMGTDDWLRPQMHGVAMHLRPKPRFSRGPVFGFYVKIHMSETLKQP